MFLPTVLFFPLLHQHLLLPFLFWPSHWASHCGFHLLCTTDWRYGASLHGLIDRLCLFSGEMPSGTLCLFENRRVLLLLSYRARNSLSRNSVYHLLEADRKHSLSSLAVAGAGLDLESGAGNTVQVSHMGVAGS